MLFHSLRFWICCFCLEDIVMSYFKYTFQWRQQPILSYTKIEQCILKQTKENKNVYIQNLKLNILNWNN